MSWERFWRGEYGTARPQRPAPVVSVPRQPAAPAAYTETLNLATARDRFGLTSTYANPIESVQVLALPAGQTVSVHFGQGAVGRPITMQGQVFDLNPPSREGVFVTNLAGAGDLVLSLNCAVP